MLYYNTPREASSWSANTMTSDDVKQQRGAGPPCCCWWWLTAGAWLSKTNCQSNIQTSVSFRFVILTRALVFAPLTFTERRVPCSDDRLPYIVAYNKPNNSSRPHNATRPSEKTAFFKTEEVYTASWITKKTKTVLLSFLWANSVTSLTCM